MARKTFDPKWLDDHRVRLPPVERDSIVGIGHVMVEVDALLARLRDPERAAALGVSAPRGILLHGDPGLGKTLVARYIATTLDPSIPFFEVSSDELSPARLKGTIHHLAETYGRCVLYLDEIDQWATNRSSPYHSPGTRLLLTAALAGLDGLVSEAGPIVIAASNHGPDQLDPALMRSGRFTFKIAFDRPNLAEREALLERFIGTRSDGDIDPRAAAEVAMGLTPADLRECVDDAAGLALADDRDAIASNDLFTALRRVGHIEPEDTSRDPDSQRRIAVHEAGHVVALVALRGPHSVHSVRMLGTHGTTRAAGEDTPGRIEPDDELLDHLVVSFAGLAAELRIFGTGSLCPADDVSSATMAAISRIQSGLDPKVPPVTPTSFGEVPPAVLLDMQGMAVAEILSLAREVAFRIMADNTGPIAQIADVLLDVEDLSGVRLQDLLDQVAVNVPEDIHLHALVERQTRRKARAR